MARLLYCFLLYLGMPLIWLRLLWRSRRQPEYLGHLAERWGAYPQQSQPSPLLWVHGVSVGETRAAQPLVQQLLAQYPDHVLLLTCMTPTGRAVGQELYGQNPRVIQAYLPYDYPGAMARFFEHFRPRFGVLMETEIWPNLMAAARSRHVPVVLANARLSSRSARGYGRIEALVRPALERLAAVAAQTDADANRLALLGAPHIQVCGNVKFDVLPDSVQLEQGVAWRARLGPRQVWLAASTREGEEALLLDILKQPGMEQVLLLLVPRHPQRFEEVAQLVDKSGLTMVRRSQEAFPDAGHQVWLGDSMGEMAAYYRVANVAYVGGSLLPLGGQNLIEAAACACPTLVGLHTFNFAQATEDAIAAGAAMRVADVDELSRVLIQLLADPERLEAMGKAGEAFAQCHRGATARTMAVITSVVR